MLQWDTAWRALRHAGNLDRLRLHDLRHTVITELTEMGVADHALESITGHLSGHNDSVRIPSFSPTDRIAAHLDGCSGV